MNTLKTYHISVVFILILAFSCKSNNVQNKYPLVRNIEVITKKDINEDEYQFLTLNSQKGINLSDYGNEKCEFNVLAYNFNTIILEFNHPSKLISKGRCAAGEEKGFLYFELDNNANLIQSKTYLLESCLWSIEVIDKLSENTDNIIYTCENLQTLEVFKMHIDTKNITIKKEENN